MVRVSMMRWLVVVLVALLVLLQIRLWFGEGSISSKIALDRQWQEQREINESLMLRNRLIAQEVESLKTNLDSLEEKARKDLGMIKEGEVFYLVTDKKEQSTADKKEP
jgi:cell division protein FtsB